jgi:hypothetical protein
MFILGDHIIELKINSYHWDGRHSVNHRISRVWGRYNFLVPFLYGDENGVSLILKKDDDTFVIQPGEKIIINDEIYTLQVCGLWHQKLLMEKYIDSLG